MDGRSSVVDREPDLTGICFEDRSYPLNAETWRDWISRSRPGFDDGNPKHVLELDKERTEEPRLYAINKRHKDTNKLRMKIYVLDNVAYQAPSVGKVVLGRVNNAAYYLHEALDKLEAKRRKLLEEAMEDETGGAQQQNLASVVALKCLDRILEGGPGGGPKTN